MIFLVVEWFIKNKTKT